MGAIGEQAGGGEGATYVWLGNAVTMKRPRYHDETLSTSRRASAAYSN